MTVTNLSEWICDIMNEKTIKNTDSWVISLVDPYYLKKVEELKAGGIPRFIGIPAMYKTEIENSIKIAYV